MIAAATVVVFMVVVVGGLVDYLVGGFFDCLGFLLVGWRSDEDCEWNENVLWRMKQRCYIPVRVSKRDDMRYTNFVAMPW